MTIRVIAKTLIVLLFLKKFFTFMADIFIWLKSI